MIQDGTSVFPEAFIELTLGLSDVLKVAPFTFYQVYKIPEISVGIQMKRSVSVSSDRNIRDHLWWWFTYFGRKIRRSILQ